MYKTLSHEFRPLPSPHTSIYGMTTTPMYVNKVIKPNYVGVPSQPPRKRPYDRDARHNGRQTLLAAKCQHKLHSLQLHAKPTDMYVDISCRDSVKTKPF